MPKNKLTKLQQGLIVNLLTGLVIITVFYPVSKLQITAFLLSFVALTGAVTYFIKSGSSDKSN